jgi:phosphatidate cytidylyltransferase
MRRWRRTGGASGGSVHGHAERSPMRWSDLGLRLASASILAPIALGCIWLGGAPFALLIGAAALGLTIEWLMLCQLPAVRRVAAPLLVAGLAYVALAAAALLYLRGDPLAGRNNVLVLVLLIWAVDIGAYLAGRMFGGPRLAPRISPGKTWSGAVGGLAAAIAVGLTAAALLSGAGAWWRAALVSTGIGIVAQAGDLLESLVKRGFGVKDSSQLIPGHGGLFDRLDGVLSAAPAAAVLALALGRGVVLWQ